MVVAVEVTGVVAEVVFRRTVEILLPTAISDRTGVVVAVVIATEVETAMEVVVAVATATEVVLVQVAHASHPRPKATNRRNGSVSILHHQPVVLHQLMPKHNRREPALGLDHVLSPIVPVPVVRTVNSISLSVVLQHSFQNLANSAKR